MARDERFVVISDALDIYLLLKVKRADFKDYFDPLPSRVDQIHYETEAGNLENGYEEKILLIE